MLNTILSALLPMVVTFLLGFVAAWHHDFVTKDASVLNRMVLVYAVPLALFAGSLGYWFAMINTPLLVPPRMMAQRNISISGCMTNLL